MTPDEARDKLEEFRVLVDDVDRRIVALLNERTRVVENIGRVKRQTQMPIYEPKREDQVFANISVSNRGPLTEEAVRRIFERIIDEMRMIQRLWMKSDGRAIDDNRHAAGRHGAADPEGDRRLVEMGFDVHRSTGVIHTVLGGWAARKKSISGFSR